MNLKEINIGAVCGSVRARSTNLDILRFIGELCGDRIDFKVNFKIYDGLTVLPHFNPDWDIEGSDYQNVEVNRWRQFLGQANGLIFCTPEYAHGVPGALKNALDWAVSSGELVDKPTAIITASPSDAGGENALASLLPTIKVMSAKIIPNGTLKIGFVKRKINGAGAITDDETLQSINLMLATLLTDAREFCNSRRLN